VNELNNLPQSVGNLKYKYTFEKYDIWIFA